MNRIEILSYLNRIGAEEPAARDEGTLDRLIVSHLQAVPFENLDVVEFGLIPDLQEEKLYEKIVTRKRGGYCFELNSLFQALLKGLGYTVYPVGVRVVWNRDFIPPLSHMGLVAELNGAKYYCDVGFGGPGPKGLLRLEPSEQDVNGDAFRVRAAEDGDCLVERNHHGAWKAVLRFTDRPVRMADFQLMNFYCARSEAVLFSRTRVLNLCTPRGSKALTGLELVVREDGKERRTVYNNQTELEEGIEREFGIRVPLSTDREEQADDSKV